MKKLVFIAVVVNLILLFSCITYINGSLHAADLLVPFDAFFFDSNRSQSRSFIHGIEYEYCDYDHCFAIGSMQLMSSSYYRNIETISYKVQVYDEAFIGFSGLLLNKKILTALPMLYYKTKNFEIQTSTFPKLDHTYCAFIIFKLSFGDVI